MYISINDKQNYPLCMLKLLIETSLSHKPIDLPNFFKPMNKKT